MNSNRRAYRPISLRSSHVGVVALSTLLAMGRPAFAQSAATTPERLFDEGRAAMQQGDYATACQKFAESNRLEPALGTQFNLAHCEEERGHVLAAWTLFRRVRGELQAEDRRVPVADQHIAALSARLAHLRVVLPSGTPAGAQVRVDGAVSGAPDATGLLPIESGKHRVTVVAPGRTEESRVLEFSEGQTIEFRVPAEQTVPATFAHQNDAPRAPSPPASPAAADDDHASEAQRTTAFIVGGVGAVALLVGTITGIAGLHQESVGNANCSDASRTCTQKGIDANRSARSLATLSTVGFVLGLGGVGVGGYLYLSATPRNSSASARAQSKALALTWGGEW